MKGLCFLVRGQRRVKKVTLCGPRGGERGGVGRGGSEDGKQEGMGVAGVV